MSIQEALAEWEDIEIGPHRYGGIEYRLNGEQIGHTHGDHQADIKFPLFMCRQLVEQRKAMPHHLHPETSWISFYIHEQEDVGRAIDLFRRAYEAVSDRHSRQAEPSTFSRDFSKEI